MPNAPILYLGDTSLSGAARYLAGIITHGGLSFDYLDSSTRVDPALVQGSRQLFVLSDYPAAMMEASIQNQLVEQVASGAGLLMIGGWESFRGKDGHWHETPLGAILPVEMGSKDDRINYDQPALVRKRQDHPAVEGLPWDTRPPAIGGFNAVSPKPGATVVLEVQRYTAQIDQEKATFEAGLCNPLLVTGSHGQGRTAALTTDVAPHWVGPLVDWGQNRLTAQAPGSGEIEVGDNYAKFLRQLLSWTGRLTS